MKSQCQRKQGVVLALGPRHYHPLDKSTHLSCHKTLPIFKIHACISCDKRTKVGKITHLIASQNFQSLRKTVINWYGNEPRETTQNVVPKEGLTTITKIERFCTSQKKFKRLWPIPCVKKSTCAHPSDKYKPPPYATTHLFPLEIFDTILITGL